MENNEEFTEIYKEYRKGKSYISSMELDRIIPDCVDFYEGRQWGKIGEKTKKLPRATFNLIELIVNSKVSTMLSSPFTVIFSSREMPFQAEKLTKFNTIIEKELGLEEIYESMLDQAAVEGSSFIHFYWDGDAIGKRGEYRGGVRAERIDLLNVVVENPCQESIQKQKWIILETKMLLEDAINICDNNKTKKLIESDTDTGIDKRVTVLTKYYRVDGEVYFVRATKNVLLHEPRPLNPGLTDYEDNFYHFRASLYPVEVYQYKQRKNCIYGRGEVEPLIANNRTINFNTAMMSKGVEDQGFGTIVQREGALKVGEKLTNDSSKIIIDRYKGGQNGFYNLSKQPFTPEAYQLNKDIISTTRELTGATEVMTGEVMYNNQSGTSIAYLQQQAMRPLEKLNKRYKKFRIRCAEVLFQFYCLYYEEKDFYFQSGEGENLENTGITISDTFKASEYKNIDFDITIQVCSTAEYSEMNQITMLDNLLKANNISLRTYFELYPDHLFPMKDRFISKLEDKEQQEKENLIKENEILRNELESIKKSMEYNQIYTNYVQVIEQNKKLLSLLAGQNMTKGE